ncbi:hypothetical protein [Massilia sp. CT11-137]|uniref:hypothetical protein n=1 Tax=Massilia sp. CT11-137 TaxID=3393901 RepID=UPI0039A68A7F
MTTGRDPACTAQLRSSHAIDADRELELAVRRNGAPGFPNVPAYWAVDARFGWRFAPGMGGGDRDEPERRARGVWRGVGADRGARDGGVKLTWQR